MSIGGLSCISSMTSLISAQSSMKSVSSVRSAQTQLETEAEIYEPDSAVGFAGDPEKADALTKKAQDLDSNIGKACSDVQTDIQDSAQASSSTETQSTDTDDSQTSQAVEDNSSDNSSENVPASQIYDSQGKLISADLVNKQGRDQANAPLHLNRLA